VLPAGVSGLAPSARPQSIGIGSSERSIHWMVRLGQAAVQPTLPGGKLDRATRAAKRFFHGGARCSNIARAIPARSLRKSITRPACRARAPTGPA
jgi:hypothetical protein